MSRDAIPVRKLAPPSAQAWAQVGEGEIFVSDLIDQARDPDAEMTVGYARLDAGESLDISFPYDEVLILTKGRYSVRNEAGETVTAQAGEAIYLPADTENSSHAEEDTEMVYVAAPPGVYAAHVAMAG